MITLVLGGTRSGKSEIAERIAARLPAPVTVVATAVVGEDRDDAGLERVDLKWVDREWVDRIAAHRARRPSSWITVECGRNAPTAIREADGTILLDALGSWVAAHPNLDVDTAGLLDALASHRGDTVIVSDEVGLGVHPSTEVGRRFRDMLGDVNRAVADVADEVLLVVAGRVLPLARLSPEEGPGD